MEIAALILTVGKAYLVLGGLVAIAFLAVGLDRIDESAHGAYVFRPLLIPGLCLIWPLVVWRWLMLERGQGG